jgi:hypothetical protein
MFAGNVLTVKFDLERVVAGRTGIGSGIPGVPLFFSVLVI